MPRDRARRPALTRATLAVAISASVGLLLSAAARDPGSAGVRIGTLLALIAAAAWTHWVVAPSPRPPRPITATPAAKPPGERVSPAMCFAAAVAVLGVGLGVGGYAALPYTLWGALLCGVPAALRRPGLAMILVIAALYVPSAGTYGLMDPWESHYGEVSREILARNDWISLWWAQDKWFWSKPALLFWSEAWSMGLFGVDPSPDAHPLHPEWALRLPVVVMAMVALGTVYVTVRRFFGARAGALAGLTVATMPLFFFVAHQAITDIPLVAAITVAACCLLLAMHEDPAAEVSRYRIGPFALSAQHVAVFALILIVLPQATYLMSRNLVWADWHLVTRPDVFLYGSGGNAGIPGNPDPRNATPAVAGFLGQPFIQGVAWMVILGWLLWLLRRERRRQGLLMVVFYLACGLGFLAKGLLGVAVPGLLALLYLLSTGRWSLLTEGRLRIAMGSLLVVAVSLPWYVAMLVRHGVAFTNRLLIHDHINRLAAGVHGDGGTIEYFLAQFGYATFPWIGFVPVAWVVLLAGRAGSGTGDRGRRDAVLFFGIWWLSTFVVFSAMATKFHHYILPSVVPAGVLVGVAVAACWGARSPRATWLAAGSAVLLVGGVTLIAGDARGIVPVGVAGIARDDWVLAQGDAIRGGLLAGLAIVLASMARVNALGAQTELNPPSWSRAVSVAAALGACLVAFVGRDLSWVTNARPQGNERLLHLFIYNYGRLWPSHLDYRPILIGFSVAACLATAMAFFESWRPIAVRGLATIAVTFCAWGLVVYLPDAADHWTFRNLADRYYEDRPDDDTPLLAWQMNWKGENFYTGNRVFAFPELDNERLEAWLAENEGRLVYVVLEHKRLPKFRRLIGDRAIRTLSDDRESNKFLLVALEI
ncbi:MAG: glycosyltransferase family 39 protein [Myxococcota bacterium]